MVATVELRRATPPIALTGGFALAVETVTRFLEIPFSKLIAPIGVGVDASIASRSILALRAASVPTSVRERLLEMSTPVVALVMGATLTPLVTLGR